MKFQDDLPRDPAWTFWACIVAVIGVFVAIISIGDLFLRILTIAGIIIILVASIISLKTKRKIVRKLVIGITLILIIGDFSLSLLYSANESSLAFLPWYSTSRTITPPPLRNICQGTTETSQNSMTPVRIGTTFCIYRGHKGPVNAVAWSPSGQRIASGGNDGTVQVWISDTGDLVYSKSVSGNSPVTAVAWSPDGNYIAFGNMDGDVRVLLADTGSCMYECNPLEVTHVLINPRPITSVAWSGDSKRIVAASDNGTIEEWIVDSGENNFALGAPNSRITAVSWAPHGNSMAYAIIDNEAPFAGHVQIINFTNGYISDTSKSSHILIIWAVKALAWSCDGKYIALGSTIGTVYVWDITASKLVEPYYSDTKEITSVSWSPEGMYIASASADGNVRVWLASEKGQCQ